MPIADIHKRNARKERDKQIVAARVAGASYDDLAKQFDLDKTRCGQICRAAVKADATLIQQIRDNVARKPRTKKGAQS